ncbi:hypothetical protein VitviT2T_008279 [Vitis vinifera]|uniref:NAC domain-containing protein n=1 Tax=Vitis vinifera TaxID=29760 RepID=A0ABY9C1G8_VITVI|nr:hypothetical protein VitviT2T_008279 [Vitis vinifera]
MYLSVPARYEPSGKDEWFYFTPRDRKYQNGQRPNRSAGNNGYWKATGADKEIIFEDRKVGYRKPLAFHRRNPPRGVKTNWMMHEFKVAEPPEPLRRTGVNEMRSDDCVLCRVYRKDDSRDRDCKRSRDKSVIDESSSSSKISRLELNPNKANNQITVGGGMESDNLQVLHPAGTDVSFHGQNNNLMQSMDFTYSDHSWDREFRSSNIGNAVFVSPMDLNPDYIPRRNMGNTGLAMNDARKFESLLRLGFSRSRENAGPDGERVKKKLGFKIKILWD